ncbi:Retrovirus-related Pol polyprotein from transposon 297 [Araneus ventricosus]|uniref:RNA-directed DNA polymerase n=1 Tax=Araneus ventricosus TaxID=182803 RepID=A0A4Y2JN73_ARAVE|nr:Retrovirus-related Pol polyprotein from transposon 297 [Araneus ventricosus]
MAENTNLLALLAEMKKSMEKGQEEMKTGQEEMRKGQEKMKNQIQSHIESKVREIKDHVNSCIEKIEDVQIAKREIGEVKDEVERKIEEVEDKVQGKIEEVEEKVQVKIGDREKRLSELDDIPVNFPVNPELTYSRPTVKSLTFDGQTSWTVFKTEFGVVSSENGWNNRVKSSQLVASLRGSAAEVLNGIPSDKLTDLWTIEKALEARFGDNNLTQFYRSELKARRQKPGESLQVLTADVERLMSLAYAECPQDVRDSLAAQYFVDVIRDEDTQHATRLMDVKGLKFALAYSMKYEAAKTVSKTSRNIRSIEIEDGNGREKVEKFDCLLKTLEKLLNIHVAGKQNTPRRKPNVTCWKCNKKGIYVADITDPCILGLDFLQKFNFTVDLEKNEIRTGGEEIPLFSASAKLCSVLAKEKNIIPTRSECLIQGVPEVSGKFRYSVTDFPSQVSQKGVLVAATLVDLKREARPVQVLNLDNKPKTVDKGAVIATCEPVVDVVARPQEFSESLRLPLILENLEGLNEEQRTAVKELLQGFQNLFSTSDSDVDRCNFTQHRINTGNPPSIKQYPRRLPLSKKEEVERLVKEMVDNGIIEESSGPWASPIVLVKKKDGSTHFCVDYRKLNKITIKGSYPLPRIDDTLDALNGSQWFSTLDLKSGYWQVEIQSEDKEKTAFTTGQGLWQFNITAFGLYNAPATFERLMETVLRGLTSEACLFYLDDIIIVGRTFEEHFNNIRKVLQRLQKTNLKLSPKKCRFFRKEVSYLGHIISADGVKTNPEKTKAVVDWPRPETVHDLRSFLGLSTYYRRFVRNFSAKARPLHKLSEARSNFNWTEECEKSFHSLKQDLITSPVLTYPRTDKDGYGC